LVVSVLTPGAAGASLDRGFSGDGRATVNFTPRFDGAKAVAVQPDGKIVAAGSAAGKGGRFALARFRTDGTLDPAFGGDGRVLTNFTRFSDVAYGVAILPDGRIVAVGAISRLTEIGSAGRFALGLYHPDGTRDTSFGGDGRVTTNFTAGEDRAVAVAIHAGRILAVGSANFGCTPCSRFALARYDLDGSLDASFSGDGMATTGFRFGGDGQDVDITPNGKIVVAGGNTIVTRFNVARYRDDGTLDAAFGGDGKVSTRSGKGDQSATGVAVQANGKVVAAGYTDMPHEFGDPFGPGRFALVRYRVDGTLDPAWGADGIVKTRFGRSHSAAEDVAIQSDGRIVAAGHVDGVGGRFALTRYFSHGALDRTFGGDGRVTTNFTGGEDLAFGVDVRDSRKIVAAGQSAGRGGRFAVARYIA
jgi:uncharacterized delta-60 repeat protein